MLPDSARSHYRTVQRIQATLLVSLRRLWRQMHPDASWSRQWETVGPRAVTLVSAAQLLAAREADAYVADVLRELGLVAQASAGVIAPAAYVGVAGDGRDLGSLLAGSVAHAGRHFGRAQEVSAAVAMETKAYNAAMSALDPDYVAPTVAPFDQDLAAREALASGGSWLTMAARTAVADVSRAAESAAMTTHRQVGGYVRMLNPPSCGRCTILAGRFYRWNAGFDRHPGCDCVHIPSSEAIAGDLTVDPQAYFDSLDAAGQAKLVGSLSNAQAVRDGADIGQVVNAYRKSAGMQVAQASPIQTMTAAGRQIKYTTEGTTRRGAGYSAMRSHGAVRASEDARRAGERYFRATPVRVMPETIYRIADDRDDAIRLLKLYGWIL